VIEGVDTVEILFTLSLICILIAFWPISMELKHYYFG
jgi:hypothetical protein